MSAEKPSFTKGEDVIDTSYAEMAGARMEGVQKSGISAQVTEHPASAETAPSAEDTQKAFTAVNERLARNSSEKVRAPEESAATDRYVNKLQEQSYRHEREAKFLEEIGLSELDRHEVMKDMPPLGYPTTGSLMYRGLEKEKDNNFKSRRNKSWWTLGGGAAVIATAPLFGAGTAGALAVGLAGSGIGLIAAPALYFGMRYVQKRREAKHRARYEQLRQAA